jgi:hypothetical protein
VTETTDGFVHYRNGSNDTVRPHTSGFRLTISPTDRLPPGSASFQSVRKP